jgi:hypothetical protein
MWEGGELLLGSTLEHLRHLELAGHWGRWKMSGFYWKMGDFSGIYMGFIWDLYGLMCIYMDLSGFLTEDVQVSGIKWTIFYSFLYVYQDKW